jgi:hypothetical protein
MHRKPRQRCRLPARFLSDQGYEQQDDDQRPEARSKSESMPQEQASKRDDYGECASDQQCRRGPSEAPDDRQPADCCCSEQSGVHAALLGHRVTEFFNAANLLGPMPETS